MALARVLDERRVGAEADRLVQPAGRLGLAVNDRLATTFLVEAVQCERADDRAEAAAAKLRPDADRLQLPDPGLLVRPAEAGPGQAAGPRPHHAGERLPGR